MDLFGKLVRMGLIVGAMLAPCISEGLLVSTKASGRACATVALPSDSFVAAYNPAGIAWTGCRWDLALNWERDWGNSHITGNFDPNNNGTMNSHNDCENFFLPEFGVCKNLCCCQCQLSIGFIVYNRNFSKIGYGTNIPIFGDKRLGLEYLQETASPVLTILFGQNHALGVSIDFVGQRFKVNGLEHFANHFRSVSPHHVTNKGYQYSLGIGGTVGWMSKVSDCVTIGAAYQPQVVMRHVKGYNGLLAKHGKFNLPQRVLGGFAVQFWPGTYFDFDVEYVQWVQIAALEHRLRPAINHLHSFGSERGVGLGWRDQIHYRIGLEWQIIDCLAIRGGYSYCRTAVRKKEALMNILCPNIVEHCVATGATWCAGCDNEISFFLSFGFRNNVNGTNAIPDSLGGGSVKLTEYRTWAGVSWGRKF